jgi:hypothetical protein
MLFVWQLFLTLLSKQNTLHSQTWKIDGSYNSMYWEMRVVGSVVHVCSHNKHISQLFSSGEGKRFNFQGFTVQGI